MSEAHTPAGTGSPPCGQRRHTLWPWRRRTKLCGSTSRDVAPPAHRAVEHIQLGLHHGIHEDTNTTHGHRSNRSDDNNNHTEVGGLADLARAEYALARRECMYETDRTNCTSGHPPCLANPPHGMLARTSETSYLLARWVYTVLALQHVTQFVTNTCCWGKMSSFWGHRLLFSTIE